MTRSEAGKLGYASSSSARASAYAIKRDRYDANPKMCKCGEKIPFEKRLKHEFCSKQCAAVGNVHAANYRNCVRCGGDFYGSKSKVFCREECSVAYRNENTFQQFLKGKIHSPATVRKYLIKLRGSVCEECRQSEWRGSPIPLDVHHLNGDWKNDHPDNLRLLCKNCHALTPEYGGRNRGKGRKFRYQFVAQS